LHALGPIETFDIRKCVSDSITSVFETLFSLKLETAETASSSGLEGSRYVASVGFAGDATGSASIHIDQELARRLTAILLGQELETTEGEAEIRDMLGELGNLVGGNLKSALTDRGLRCTLGTPSVTSSSDFMIDSANLDHYERIAFHADGRTVFLEVGVKISEHLFADMPVEENIYRGEEDFTTLANQPAAAAVEGQTASPPVGDIEKEAALEQALEHPPTQPVPDAPVVKTAPAPDDFGLDILIDIPVELRVELGRTKLPIQELLKLQPGSAIKLARLEGEPVDILANDVLIARGEVVVRNEKYGIRITEITRRADRLKGLT
jgi:flagellar motor switch protein FliN